MGEAWVYEPKFDGFRVIAFVDGKDVYLQSRGAKPLRRYFPELELPPGRYVLDGELLILGADGHEQFDALQNRLHPTSRGSGCWLPRRPPSCARSTSWPRGK